MDKRKGRICWVPPAVVIELDDIKREDAIGTQADAFKELTKYARVGREAKRAMKLDWRKAEKLPSIADLYPEEKKKRKRIWL